MELVSHCLLCNRSDSADNLVQCDKCDGYVHFSCAEVGDSIADADRSFTCRKCAEYDERNSISSHRSSRRSRTMSGYSLSATRVRLRLEQLETDRQNRLRELEDAERFQRLRRQVDADIDKQRFEILDAQLLDEEEHRSVRSEVSSRIIRENTSQWIGAASQTEGQVVTTSATAAATLTHTDVAVHTQNGDQSRSGGKNPTSSAVTELEGSFRSEDMVSSSEATFVIKPAVVPLSLSRHKQVRIESNSLELPQLRHMQNPVSNKVSNLPPSMQQLSVDQRIRWDQSVLQPSGYENFVENLTTPASRATNVGDAISTVQPPVVQQSEVRRNFSQDQLSSVRQQQCSERTTLGIQQFPVTPAMHQQCPIPPSSCTVPQAGHQQFPVPTLPEPQQFSVPQAVQPQFQSAASSGAVPRLEHLQFSASQSGHQQFPILMPPGFHQSSVPQQFLVPTSSGPVQQSAHQQLSVPSSGYQVSGVTVPTSPVFMLTAGQQQYHIPKPPEPEPLPRPGQLLVSGNKMVRPVPVQQHIPDPVRSRTTGPTSEQLAARQVISRELPVFSGDPQDWPLFFSSFRNSTEACGYNDAENLARLQRCLRGPALESVRSRLLIPESVPHVVNTLQRLYGRPEVIIMSLLRRMRETPSPKGDDLKTLIKFGMGVESLVDHMVLAEQQQHISNPMLLQELVDRLPPNLKLQWASYKRNYQAVDLVTFNAFMKELVEMASDVTPFVDLETQGKREKPTREKLFVHQQVSVEPVLDESSTESEDIVIPVSKPCIHCDKLDHRIAECPDFKKLTMDERWKLMRQKGLCRLCLVPHRSWPCRSRQECGVGDCRMRHHPLMHMEKPDTHTPTPPTATNQNVAHQHHHTPTPSALLRYIPVTLHGNGKSVDVYALLDDGSTSTMLESKVANLLGVEGPSEPLCLCWTGDVKRMEKNSQRIEITISGRNMDARFPLRTRTVEQLKLPSQTIVYEELCKDHPLLRKLPLCGYTDVTPQLVIGVDNAKLISALESRESGSAELIASKTRLGWCLYGQCTTERNPVEYVNTHVEQSEKEAVKLINEGRHECSKAGMQIQNLSSNSTEMHECVGGTCEVQQKSFKLESYWHATSIGEPLEKWLKRGRPLQKIETQQPHRFDIQEEILRTIAVDECMQQDEGLNKERSEEFSTAEYSWAAMELHRDKPPPQFLRRCAEGHPVLVDEERCHGWLKEETDPGSSGTTVKRRNQLDYKKLANARIVGDPEETFSSESELHGRGYVGEPTVSSPPAVK